MKEQKNTYTSSLAEHFFRNEYGKMVVVISRYLGINQIETAEDIVQETLLKAVENWQQNGMPPNPEGWLYTTAKNITLNILKRDKNFQKILTKERNIDFKTEENLNFSDNYISDEQLRMMLSCCHPNIPENTQIALILKILCGFSIKEIANAYQTSTETINKRLVRGRKLLRDNHVGLQANVNINKQLPIILKTIYLIFNEGYSPHFKNDIIQFDLCLEAVRICEIIINNPHIFDKTESHALAALMYFNTSRFKARFNKDNEIIDLKHQERNLWDQRLIQRGIHYLNLIMNGNKETISKYFILASISMHHCLATHYSKTNWNEILMLYDILLNIENSATVKLNRAVIICEVQGIEAGIESLKPLENEINKANTYLFHATYTDFLVRKNDLESARVHFKKAIKTCKNKRDLNFLEKKFSNLVPIL